MYRETSDAWVINPVVMERDFMEMKDLCIEFATSIDFELDYQQLLRESASIREIYKMPSGAGFILKIHNQSIGFISLRRESFNVAEISRFYLRQSSAFMRLSKNLLEVALAWASQSGFGRIKTEISAIHPSLRKLLVQSGFNERRVNVESNGGEAVLLEKSLSAVPEYS